jgi:quinol monooxygenase YgiN
MASKADSIVHIVAVLKFKPDVLNEVRPIINRIAESTRKEEGCLVYDWFTDLKDSNTIVFLEKYTSMSAVQAHSRAEHTKQGMKELGKFVTAKPDIRLLKAENSAKL